VYNINILILLSTTNKMQRYTIFFIIVDALNVSGGFSAHHQELTNCSHSIWYVPVLLLLPLAWLSWNKPNHASGSSSNLGTYQMLCEQFVSS
jgi:hypothetical protein